MDIVNLKMLGVYYAVQNILVNNVASPMARDIKPIIAMVKGDCDLLTEKISIHTDSSLSADKLNAYLMQLFAKVDSGTIKTEKFLGHQFSAEETIKRMQMHDSFMNLYDAFFDQFENKQVIQSIKDMTLTDLKGLKIEKGEYWMFKQMMIEEDQRSPITLELERLRDVVDLMYEASSKYHGPVATDKFLSSAVGESMRKVPSFRADDFL